MTKVIWRSYGKRGREEGRKEAVVVVCAICKQAYVHHLSAYLSTLDVMIMLS